MGDDIEAVRKIIEKHLPQGCQFRELEIGNLAYLVTLTRNAPRTLTHGAAHRELAKAIRIILTELPSMINEAEREAEAAKKTGRATDMDHFARQSRLLVQAALPFKGITNSRDKRSWWHGWARMMKQTIEVGLPVEHRDAVSFQKADEGRGILILQDLLELVGMENLPGNTIKSALSIRKRADAN